MISYLANNQGSIYRSRREQILRDIPYDIEETYQNNHKNCSCVSTTTRGRIYMGQFDVDKEIEEDFSEKEFTEEE